MAALKKALVALFGGRGRIPTEEELDATAARIFSEVRDTVKDDGGGDCITRKDLYAYLVKNSESGISQKTVELLFKKVDINSDGQLDEQEFMQVIQKCYVLLKQQLLFDDQLTHSIPEVIVVPGSSAHNARSGTQAFGVAVVRRKEMRRLWDWYCELDCDNDGYISLPEFKRYIKRKQSHVSGMATSIFRSLDTDEDGIINFKGLLHSLFPAAAPLTIRLLMRMARPKNYEPSGPADTELLQDVRNVFKIFDDDHSGTLDMEEFSHALTLLGFDEEEGQQIFAEIDKDGSGEVSIEEFEAWYGDGQRMHAKRMAEVEQDSDADEDDL